ncbi:acyl-CoA N-acyltransferase [Polyplosphaeria fusca]|uniref:Acyl-CoA N-acyltransferase n=1 Tax=Polyplosphaeria fusca TaxID=682080 RepID=A0A9P4QY46_9PLEO|nr:acyl-CoA N-acyltransferase [Polyplosphaeria fusca]
MFIRPITRADLPEVAAITHAAFWDDSVYQYMQPRQHLYPDDVRRQQVLRLRLRLARSDCHGFVMVTEESDANWKGRSEVAGFAFLERHGGNDENAQKWNNDSWFKKLERYLLSWEIFYEKKVMDRASDAQRINKWIEYCNAHDFVNLIEPVWHVAVLAVSPRHQRKGVGGKFIQFSQGLAADENIPMMLEASEAGLPLYQKLGCKIVDETVVDECMKGITLLWEPEHLKGKWVEDCGDGIFKVKGSQ